MQTTSCSTTMLVTAIVSAFVVILLLLGVSSVSQSPGEQQNMQQTADTIRATNAQVEIFQTQTAQAPTATP